MRTTRGVLLLLVLSASSLADSDNSADTTAVTKTTRQMLCISQYQDPKSKQFTSKYCAWRMIMDRNGDDFTKNALSPFTPVPPDLEQQNVLVFGDFPTLNAVVVYCKCYEPSCNVEDDEKFKKCITNAIASNDYSSSGWNITELSKIVEVITGKTIQELTTTTTTTTEMTTTTPSGSTSTEIANSTSAPDTADSTMLIIVIVVVTSLFLAVVIIVGIIVIRKKKAKMAAEKTPTVTPSKPTTQKSVTPKTVPIPTTMTEPNLKYGASVWELVEEIIAMGVKRIIAVHKKLLAEPIPVDEKDLLQAEEEKEHGEMTSEKVLMAAIVNPPKIDPFERLANATYVNESKSIVLAQDSTEGTIMNFLEMIISLDVGTIFAVGEASKDPKTPRCEYVPKEIGRSLWFGPYKVMLVMERQLDGAALTHSRISLQKESGPARLVDHVRDGLGPETSLPNVDRMAAVGRLLLLENALTYPGYKMVVHGATRMHRAAGYCLLLDVLRLTKHSSKDVQFSASWTRMRKNCKEALSDPIQYVAAQAAYLRVMAHVGLTTEAMVTPFVNDYNALSSLSKTPTKSGTPTPR